MQTDPILTIERAIIERLRAGLGKMVSCVESYGGEFDEDLNTVVRRLPAAWVTFAGIPSTRALNTMHSTYQAVGRFVVLVGQRSIRSESSSRQGGPATIGAYTLVRTVRRLLAGQDFGLAGVDYMRPGAVRTLFNGLARNDAVAVLACEFDVAWTESPLEAGRWPAPEPGNPNDQDAVFAEHGGRLDAPYPDLERVRLDHRLPTTADTTPPDASDIVQLNKEQYL